jgi:hypothetical protein
MGYSMGGGGTLNAGANIEAIEEYNIAVGVAMHPMVDAVTKAKNVGARLSGDPIMHTKFLSPVIPTLYAVG